ncbi:MAG: hypothetical protein HY858_12315 [Candidatus Solibacter usitatus]|nr:hypothetical protein [Candidatus Solibacter usitatus]
MALSTRRSFLLAPGLFTAREAVAWAGANDRVNMAVAGMRAQAFTAQLGGGRPRGYAGMRKVLEDKSIHAVSIAPATTGTRWA